MGWKKQSKIGGGLNKSALPDTGSLQIPNDHQI
jgi:hypothetical protein